MTQQFLTYDRIPGQIKELKNAGLKCRNEHCCLVVGQSGPNVLSEIKVYFVKKLKKCKHFILQQLAGWCCIEMCSLADMFPPPQISEE